MWFCDVSTSPDSRSVVLAIFSILTLFEEKGISVIEMFFDINIFIDVVPRKWASGAALFLAYIPDQIRLKRSLV